MVVAGFTGKGRRAGHAVFGAAVALLFVVLGLVLSSGARAAAPLELTSYKMAGDAMKMRIVMNFDREPDVKWFLLRGPNRLVVDLPATRFAVDAKDLKARGLVRAVRYGDVGEGVSRMIVTGKGPFAVDRVDVLKNDDGQGYRIAIDMSASSPREFEAALAIQAQTTGATVSTDKGDRVATVPKVAAAKPDHRFTIVLDPGHGGIDGGAEGLNGTVEKNVTLAFARGLVERLNREPGIKAVLTREDDRFLSLSERVQIAREKRANLFVSLHADTLQQNSIRGATVYTISDNASDGLAAALAKRENLSDEIAGIKLGDEPAEVADILLDLTRRETQAFSIAMARSVVGAFEGQIGLINNPHRYAGFRVLQAPDVPSILLELGFLSNPEDEKLLLDEAWRAKVADLLAVAVRRYREKAAADGG